MSRTANWANLYRLATGAPRRTQELVGAIQWGFKSPLPHHVSIQRLRGIFTPRIMRRILVGSLAGLQIVCKFFEAIDRAAHGSPVRVHQVPARR
jgi:hypothetical protein